MVEASPQLGIGRPLRALRESRQISLEDMARATRISVGQLEALESDDFTALPASVFVKGFIRSYCQYLGESSDEAIERYRAALGEPSAAERAALAAPRRAPRSASPILISVLLLVVFGGGLAALTYALRHDRGAAPAAIAQRPTVTGPAVPPAERATQPSASADSVTPERGAASVDRSGPPTSREPSDRAVATSQPADRSAASAPAIEPGAASPSAQLSPRAPSATATQPPERGTAGPSSRVANSTGPPPPSSPAPSPASTPPVAARNAGPPAPAPPLDRVAGTQATERAAGSAATQPADRNVATAPTHAPAPPARAGAAGSAPGSAEASPGAQRLVVRATEPTWIRVQIGGGRTVEELLPAGASREWFTDTRFLLTVGNAGGIEVELNGRLLPSLGPKGVVIRGVSLPPAASPSGS